MQTWIQTLSVKLAWWPKSTTHKNWVYIFIISFDKIYFYKVFLFFIFLLVYFYKVELYMTMEPTIIMRWVHHHYHGSSCSFPLKKKITIVTSSSFLLFCLPSYTIIRLNCQLPSYGPSGFPFLVLVSSFLHHYICSNHVGVGSRSVDDYHYPVGVGKEKINLMLTMCKD